MKKITLDIGDHIHLLDSTDYMKIEKNNQYINDKYVDYRGKKFNEYDYSERGDLKKGNLIIRLLYDVYLDSDNCLYFRKFKYYIIYLNSKEYLKKIKQNLDTKNSVFDFDGVKRNIIILFLNGVKIDLD